MFGKLISKLTGEPTAEDQALAEAMERARRWAIFVEYHNGAPWAKAKAEDAAGALLNDQAVEYMQQEIERRRLLKEHIEKEFYDGPLSGIKSNAADAAAANGNAGPDPVRRSAEPKTGDGADGAIAGIDPIA